MKKELPHYCVCISFFSPSGYEVRKHYASADIVTYLPLDTPNHAQKWLDILRPDYVFFVKYDIWGNFLREIHRREIPVFLIAAKWRKESSLFHFPLRFLYRRFLGYFSIIFTQDSTTTLLLQAFVPKVKIVTSGDTRFDRVSENASKCVKFPEIERFIGVDKFVVIAGSAWKEEEKMILESLNSLPASIQYIIAPHEIYPEKIAQSIAQFPEISVRYSDWKEGNSPEHARILWIDNVGMLAHLYQYADWALVGGGFNGNLHNILEPAAFGCIVGFGNQFKTKKYPEAIDLIANGGAVGLENLSDFQEKIRAAMEDKASKQNLGLRNQAFVQQHLGATQAIFEAVFCEKDAPTMSGSEG
jgi:3-deoxy-D-manno-octulosonic-acid transferase